MKNLGDLIDHRIRENFSESVPSNEVRDILEKTLRENGFSEIASSYINA